jgi:cytochrome c oxidase assembly factor CtaG/putative copper export protein
MKRSPIALLAPALIVLAVAATAVGLVISGSAYEAPPAGIPDVGGVVGWGTPVVRTLTDIAAVVTIGFLLAAVVLDPSGKDGTVSRAGRTDLIRAAVAAFVWAVLALVQSVLVVGNVLGLQLSEAISPDVLTTYAFDLPTTRALFGMAILALVISAACAATFTVGSGAAWLILALLAAILPALGGHAAGLGDHALAMTSGAAHIAAASLWIGGLLALALHALRGDISLTRSIQRFGIIAGSSIVLLAVSGVANAYTRLETLDQILTTGYGQLVLIKTALIVVLGVIALLIRRRISSTTGTRSGRSVFARIAGLELTVMAISLGIGVALSQSAPPRLTVELPTYGESLLGYRYPESPTVASVLGGFHLEPFFFAMVLIAGALYFGGLRRLRKRGDSWPLGRSISWFLGLIVVLWCTNGGISMYASVSVGMHMLQHMTLTMLAPILLVMGAPATLALRALKPSTGPERGPREWLMWFLHSWITRILTNPFYVFVVYVLGLYGLYLTPAFGWLMGSHVGHIVMELHFLFSGYLFYWVIIGIDPRPRPLPYWGRLLLLLLSMSVHAFFAVILMMGTTPIAPEWYGLVRPDWITDPLADSLNGGQVAWGIAEIPSMIVLLAIAFQWSRSDDREAKRKDRQADRDGDAELNAYNDRLARLAERDNR